MKQVKKPHLYLASVLVVVGIVGLLWAMNSATSTTDRADTGSELRVQAGGDGSTNQSQSAAGLKLQGAAKTKDLLNGRSGDNLQQGSSIDSLTKGANFQ